jgi:hypothetical protein
MAIKVNSDMMRRGWRREGLRTRLGLIGGLWAGLVLAIFTFAGGRTIFMEKPLSLNHQGLEKKCGNCHHPFQDVSDETCATNCHSKNYDWNKPVDFRVTQVGIPYPKEIHYYSGKFARKNGCLDCHPAECHSRDLSKQPLKPMPDFGVRCEAKNQDNLVLPQPLAEYTCKSCHKKCERSVRCYDCHIEHGDGMPLAVNRPGEVFFGAQAAPVGLMTPRGSLLKFEWTEQTMLNFEKTRGRMSEFNCMGCHPDVLHRKPPTPDDIDKSMVSRTIFRHDSPGHRRYWHCTECHIHKFPTARDREENIFTMEACAKRCHFADDCAGCHRFHDPVRMPNENVDWPERLKVYDRLIGIDSATSEFSLGEGGAATGESGFATGESGGASGEIR